MATADPTAPETGVMPGDGDSSREIVRRTRGQEYAVDVMPLMSDGEIRRTWRVAQALAASGMFKDATQAEQAFGKILLGRDLGLSPTQSLTGIHLVEGKPEIAAVTLASFVRRRPEMRYQVVEHTNDACELHFFAVGEPQGDDDTWRVHSEVCGAGPLAITDDDVEVEGCTCRPSHLRAGESFLGSSRFTTEDAELAGLLKPTRSGQPSNHTKYPRNMKFARAMSNGIKWYVPEATGGIPVYHEGELEQAVIEAPRAAAEELRTLPEPLAGLLARASAVDSRRWRRNEVLARLPHPEADGFAQAVESVAAEIQAWLAEADPPDADVVEEGESLADAEAAATAETEPDEPAGSELERRYANDSEWREKVDVLLSRHADLEAAHEQHLDENENARADEIREELDRIEGDLDALGVPVGWFPQPAVQTRLEA